MAISTVRILDAQAQLLDDDDDAVLHGYEDYKGFPTQQSKSGGWRSASFILVAGSIERFAYYGIESNLINYLTGQLGESVATAAANVNTWIGAVWLAPILGAFIGDTFLGRYRTIIITSILYILGLGFLTLVAILISSSQFPESSNYIATSSNIELQILLFLSLYLVAIAQGYRTCVQAFGADQFDGEHPEESRVKSSFFNWWYCGLCVAGVVSHLTLHYIQDNISWSLGFGIPCLSMVLGLILFSVGNRTYRFAVTRADEGTQFESHKLLAGSDESKDNAANIIYSSSRNKNKAKKVLRLFPIWAPCVTYGITVAQGSTLFVKQATTLDRSIGRNFIVPSAAIRTFLPLSIVLFITLYDRIFITMAKRVTRKQSGITPLQRIGTGMAISVIMMAFAGVVERKRLETAQQFGLVDIPDATVPMSFWWLVPQYVLLGLTEVFTPVGMQEFFYDQVPSELRSVGLSFYLGAVGVGNFFSSFLVSIIQKTTTANGRGGWFSDNLNRAHLDFFYWILAGIDVLGLIAFIFLANLYTCDEQNALEESYCANETMS